MVLGRWAACSPDHDPTLPLSAASLMLSFRTMFNPARARGLSLRAAIAVGAEQFRLRVKKATLRVERGVCERPDLTIAAPAAMPIAGIVYGKVPPEELAGDGLFLEGDRVLLDRFIDLFHLPAKVR
jgi:hypothetical protein